MDLSIIVVNWNTKDLLRNCLRSVYHTVQGFSFEVIVVDNASSDGSVAMLEDEFSGIRIINNTKNLGFGVANNQALDVMTGRYALLLNSDTVLTANAVDELYRFMENHPEAGMVCGQLLNADGSKQNSIANFPSLLTLLLNTPLLEYLFPRYYPSKRYDHHNPIEIDSGIGACLMARRQTIKDIGTFDERYFFFFEETDWAYRMKKKGWKIFFIPSAFIYHLQGQSIGSSLHSRIEFYRSRYLYFQKWNNRLYYVLVSVVIFMRLLVNWLLSVIAQVITIGLTQQERDKAKVYFKLIVWHIKGRP